MHLTTLTFYIFSKKHIVPTNVELPLKILLCFNLRKSFMKKKKKNWLKL